MTEQSYEESIFGKDNALVGEFLTMPGYLGGRHLSPLYFQGIPTEQLQRALTSTGLAGQRRVQGTRFWSTPPRWQGGGLSQGSAHREHNANPPTRDVMEVDLNTGKPINHLAFDLAHFPQVTTVEFSDGTSWQPVRYEDGRVVRIVIADANPPVIAQQVARQNTGHPQHYSAGHWRPYDLKVRCQDADGALVEPTAIRLVLTRPYGGQPPVNALGEEIPYSLGVRAFTVGYRVEGRADIPDRPLTRGSITQHQSFAETRDILGSTLSYALRETPAGNLTLGGVWRSEPQPINYAVVNLYVSLDLSPVVGDVEPEPTSDGVGDDFFLQDWLVFDDVAEVFSSQQVIDRIYLDPLVSGCTVNLYYTNDTPNPALADPWAYVRWVPINRDFKARRGMYRFDPVRARHLKLEFTHLAPEPYEPYLSQVRTVKVFPHSIVVDDLAGRSQNSGGAGTSTAQDLVEQFRFADSVIIRQITDTSGGYTPTEVFWSDDPGAAKRLRDLSSAAYNYQSWQGGLLAPQFTELGTHQYTEIEVDHDQKVAYYAGLKSLEVFRADYGASEDTDQYLDYFHDDFGVSDDGGWVIGNQDMFTTDERREFVATSRVFRSKSNITGIQFATTQSPAIDLLAGADSDFNSGTGLTQDNAEIALAASWDAVGDCASWVRPDGVPVVNPSPSTRYNTDIGTTVKVSRYNTPETPPRSRKPTTWDAIGLRYGTYAKIERDRLIYRDLDAGSAAGGDPNLFGGIRNKQAVTPSNGSRIYAAARVIAPIALESPLILRIVNIDGTVVAESSAQIPANQVVEWFADYTVGEGGDPVANVWAQVQAKHEGYAQMEQFAWNQIGTTLIPKPQVLSVELIQKGPPNASWYVDTLSLFEDPITWEFSNNGGKTFWPAYGIRNNANGVLTFPSDPLVKWYSTYDSIEGIYQNIDQDLGGKDEPTWGMLTLFDNSTISWEEMEDRSRNIPPVTNALVWRARCSRPDVHVNGLSIRPWYDAYEGGVPASEGVNVSGPNIAMYDHYQPIHFDPRYRMWNRPVPQSWYFFYRQFLLLRHEDPLAIISSGAGIYMPETFVPTISNSGTGIYLSETLVPTGDY